MKRLVKLPTVLERANLVRAYLRRRVQGPRAAKEACEQRSLALRSTNQHRPRRWLLSGGSQPRRSQLTDGRTLWRKLVLSSGES
jgi:hypothetical protein